LRIIWRLRMMMMTMMMMGTNKHVQTKEKAKGTPFHHFKEDVFVFA
jgi:hypothetical protein